MPERDPRRVTYDYVVSLILATDPAVTRMVKRARERNGVKVPCGWHSATILDHIPSSNERKTH